MDASGVTLRPARTGDAGDLARLASQLGYPASPDDVLERLQLIGTRSGHEVIVAADRDVVVGWIHLLCDIHLESGEFVEIVGLVVDEARRGKGVGGALLAAAEEWARLRGFASIRLRTNVVRNEAHAFYERAGYTVRKEQKVFMKSF